MLFEIISGIFSLRMFQYFWDTLCICLVILDRNQRKCYYGEKCKPTVNYIMNVTDIYLKQKY